MLESTFKKSNRPLFEEAYENANPIKIDIVSAAIVSALPCPKGCSLSAGFDAILNPKITTALLATSDRV